MEEWEGSLHFGLYHVTYMAITINSLRSRLGEPRIIDYARFLIIRAIGKGYVWYNM